MYESAVFIQHLPFLDIQFILFLLFHVGRQVFTKAGCLNVEKWEKKYHNLLD